MKSVVLHLCGFLLLAAVVVSGPVEEKKEELQCGPDEFLHECYIERCLTKCQHLAAPPPCPSLVNPCIMPGCLCKDKMLRNAEGKCVPKEECPEKPLPLDYV